MSIITALEVQKRNKKRVNVYLDEEYVFSLSLDEAAKLRKGQILSDNEVAQLRDQDAVAYAVDSAQHVFSLCVPAVFTKSVRIFSKKRTHQS